MITLASTHRVFAFGGAVELELRVPAGTRVRLETADCFDDQVRVPGDVLGAIDWDRVNPTARRPAEIKGGR